MSFYKKPVVLVNEELAEGVYAASGDYDDSSAPVAGSASVTDISEISTGNEWNKVNSYGVTISNSGNVDLTEWSVSLPVIGVASSATIYNTWQASASLSGNVVTITSGGGGTISAGGSIYVEVVLFYEGDPASLC